MASNRKLTGVIKGRKVKSATENAGELVLTFEDGSVMRIRTGAKAPHISAGAEVRAVRQQDTRLSLDFVDGQSVDIQTAEATSSVILRDKDGNFEYAD